MFLRLMTATVLCLAIGPALASVAPAIGEGVQISLADKQSFSAYETQVRSDLDGGVRYKEITPDKQATVRQALDRMERRWQSAGPDGKLNDNDRNEMTNDLEIVSTILRHAAADSRLICNREAPIGTKIAVNVCRTVAEIKREQDDSEEGLRQQQEKGLQVGGMQGH